MRSRLEASAKKLNEVIQEQLTQIVDLKKNNANLETKIAGMEREMLLKEAAGSGSQAYTTLNTSKDIGSMSLHDLRRED